MSYSQSMQDKALSLLAQKMETSLAVEGVLSEQGLAAMSSSENSIFVEMAKALTGTGEKIENVKEAWTRYRQQELFANLNLDEAEDVTVTTTTTITTATGTATISHEYIIRGRVYIRNQTATAYVDRHRFDFMEGSVYWAGKKVGWYDRKGVGEINGKPIRIFRPREQSDFVLAEVRQRQVAA